MDRAHALLPALHRPAAGAKRPYDDAPLPAVIATGAAGAIRADTFAGDYPWVPDLDGLTPTGTIESHDFIPAGDATRFTGAIVVPTTGTYTFWLTTDTGAEFWVQESHLIDDDFAHTGAAVSATVNLTAGGHPFRLFYRHKAGTPTLKLEYAGPSIPRQPVPPDALRLP